MCVLGTLKKNFGRCSSVKVPPVLMSVKSKFLVIFFLDLQEIFFIDGKFNSHINFLMIDNAAASSYFVCVSLLGLFPDRKWRHERQNSVRCPKITKFWFKSSSWNTNKNCFKQIISIENNYKSEMIKKIELKKGQIRVNWAEAVTLKSW